MRLEQELHQYIADTELLQQQISAAVEISQADCRDNMRTQAATYVYWAQLATLAELQHDRLVDNEEQVTAQVSLQFRMTAEQKGQKITEKMLEQLTATDPAVQAAKEQVRTAKWLRDTLKRVERGLDQRSGMLSALSYREAREWQQASGDTVLPKETDKTLDELKADYRAAVKGARVG
jgi:hypothetical protein